MATWDELILAVFGRWLPHFRLGEQDALNVVTADDPLMRLWQPIPATYNWRAGLIAEPPGFDKGLTIVHGNRGGFHEDRLRIPLVKNRTSPYPGLYRWYRDYWAWPGNVSEAQHSFISR